jgi:transposase-like protein
LTSVGRYTVSVVKQQIEQNNMEKQKIQKNNYTKIALHEVKRLLKKVEELFFSFGQKSYKNKNNQDYSSKDIRLNHNIVDVNGTHNTEAKNICATSEEMSDSLTTRDFDNVGNANLIQDNNTPNEKDLSNIENAEKSQEEKTEEKLETIRNSRAADLCPYCLSKDFVKRGTRKNKNQVVQLYLCRNFGCGRTFTAQDIKGKHFPLHIIIESMSYYNLGFSLEQTCQIIKKKFGVAPESATLSDWINEYKPLCRYERLRPYATKMFSPKETVEVVTMAHRQLYRFRYHRAKTILMLEEFKNRALSPLKEYLDNISSETPHQYFQDGERMSEIRSKFDKADMVVRSKFNFANKLTAFVLQSIPENKQRHEELQRFMIANDSCTVATEVPVYIRREDVEHMENVLKFKITADEAGGLSSGADSGSDTGGNSSGVILLKGDKQPRKFPKLLTGHIDFVQIRNGQIHLLDYKPNASKEKPIEQLTWYALAMSRLTGLRIFNFVCAWFDEKDYYQFYPLHVVKKIADSKKKRKIYYKSGEVVVVSKENILKIV